MDDPIEILQREAEDRFGTMDATAVCNDIRTRLLESWGNYPESWAVDLVDVVRLLDMLPVQAP